jgi:nitroimidazol reductase NimA-like FMN-containing flavoprotein (pyridoxamine 5'-phosphate oxidase superfamily)
MRRQDREISQFQTIEILQKGEYGVLSMCTPMNEGYGIPLNYAFHEDHIYLHCATAGSKLEYLRKNNLVSFCVVGKTMILPTDFGTLYESVIVAGTTSQVTGTEKQEALTLILEKYYGEIDQNGKDYIDKLSEKVTVLKLTVVSITGKARKQ